MGTEKRERQKAGRAARLQQQQADTKHRQQLRTLKGAAIVVVIVLAVFGFLALTRKDSKDDKAATTKTTTTVAGQSSSTTPGSSAAPAAFAFGSAKCPAADGSSPRTLQFTSAPARCIEDGKRYTATFDTTAGKVVVDLDTTKTPGTANNFVFLSRFHYYDDTKLFRVAKSIDIIQGGSPHTDDNADPGPGYNLPDEPAMKSDAGGNVTGPYTYQPGDLVMARSSGLNSAGAQFFFATGPATANLDSQGSYVVFGHVSEGLDVLQRIVATAKDVPNGEQAPAPPVTVRSVTITAD